MCAHACVHAHNHAQTCAKACFEYADVCTRCVCLRLTLLPHAKTFLYVRTSCSQRVHSCTFACTDMRKPCANHAQMMHTRCVTPQNVRFKRGSYYAVRGNSSKYASNAAYNGLRMVYAMSAQGRVSMCVAVCKRVFRRVQTCTSGVSPRQRGHLRQGSDHLIVRRGSFDRHHPSNEALRSTKHPD